jgi:hypothetical protein
MTTMRTLKHPIAMFVVTVLAVIGIGVGVLAVTVRPVRTYTVEGFLRAVGGPGPRCRLNRRLHRRVCSQGYFPLAGRIRLVSTSSPDTVYYTLAVDGHWSVNVPPGTYDVAGWSRGVQVDNHVYWTFATQVAVTVATVRNVYVAYQIR